MCMRRVSDLVNYNFCGYRKNYIFVLFIRMPALIKMTLSNGHPTPTQVAAVTKNLAAVPKNKPPQGLNRSMIARVHNVKPGCGSCGR